MFTKTTNSRLQCTYVYNAVRGRVYRNPYIEAPGRIVPADSTIVYRIDL